MRADSSYNPTVVIRTREEALKALSEVLVLDRRGQIVQITVKLAQCLTPETRQILFRAQEGLVAGRLQTRIRERETMKQQQPRPAARVPTVPDEEVIDDSRINEEIAIALEALKVAAVAFDVFPTLRGKYARWEVARAAIHYGDNLRELIRAGTDPGTAAGAERKMETGVARFRPWWHGQVPSIAQVCEHVRRAAPDSPWRVGAQSLLDIVATTELRAMFAAKENIPTLNAMIEPLARIYKALQLIVKQVYPEGLPPESALAE